jgi:hypothetical protein
MTTAIKLSSIRATRRHSVRAPVVSDVGLHTSHSCRGPGNEGRHDISSTCANRGGSSHCGLWWKPILTANITLQPDFYHLTGSDRGYKLSPQPPRARSTPCLRHRGVEPFIAIAEIAVRRRCKAHQAGTRWRNGVFMTEQFLLRRRSGVDCDANPASIDRRHPALRISAFGAGARARTDRPSARHLFAERSPSPPKTRSHGPRRPHRRRNSDAPAVRQDDCALIRFDPQAAACVDDDSIGCSSEGSDKGCWALTRSDKADRFGSAVPPKCLHYLRQLHS